MKPLDEIMDRLIQENQIHAIELEIDALSYPVISKIGDRIVEKYFVFSNQPHPVKSRPYAWIVVDSGSGELLSYNHCLYHDFAQKTGVQMGDSMDYSAPMGGTFRDILKEKKRFTALYEEVRKFAFHEQMDKDQQEILIEYASLHKKLIGKELELMYHELAPDFYSWIDRSIH